MPPLADIIFLAVLLVLFLFVGPLVGRRDMDRLQQIPARLLPTARSRSYLSTIVAEWGVTALLLNCWLLLDRSVTEIGLHFRVSGWQWVAVGISLLAAALFALHSHRAANNPEELAKTRAELGNLALLAPHTRSELRLFGWLSLTAGVCEEILYRGLLMTALTNMIGLWPAVVASSVVFGIGHAYQGASGILRTGAAGLIMALIVVFTGSLPTAMLIHTVIDLTQGRLLWTIVNTPAPTPAVPAESNPNAA
jgi:hypothetical protein